MVQEKYEEFIDRVTKFREFEISQISRDHASVIEVR